MKRIIIITIASLTSFLIASGQVSTEHLDAYLWQYPLQQGLVPEPHLMQELVAEVERIINSGDLFFRPLPNDFGDQLEDAYFLYREPGRILQTIAMAYPYLNPTMQTTLRGMVQELFANTVHQPWATVPGAPWEHYQLPVNAGKQRKSFTPSNIWGNTNFGPYRPTIQNIYNVWLYAYRTGDLASVQPYYNAIRDFYLNKVGNNHDQGRLYGTMNAHIGMARLAYLFGTEAHITEARSNLSNALNFGLNISAVDNLARYGTQGWNGAYAFAYEDRTINWVNRNYIFHNISPEIGRYLSQYLQAQTEARHNYMLNRFPLWWLRESPYFNRWTGDEAVGVPSNSFGTNVPLERWFRKVNAQTLASYMISSPVGIADSYWIEALIMALEANATDVWVDVRTTPFQTDIEQDFIWSGSLSNDWNNPGNWQNNAVPGAVNNVIIPATADYFPTLSAAGTCNNLLMESSESATASLIDNNLLTVQGSVMVQRFVNSANWSDKADGWHFLSSPVQQQPVSGLWTPSGAGNDYDFYAWSASDLPLRWLNQKFHDNNLTHFIPGVGYLVAYQSGGVRLFEGALNTGNVPVTLFHTPGSNWSGWNLIGNPYPSSIDWNLADRSFFEDDFAYIYNSSRPGGAGYVPIDGGAAGAFIAPHQGYFARAGQGSHNQTFTFTNALRAHGGAWLKDTSNDDMLSLRLTCDNYFDEIILRFIDGSDLKRDRRDALKLFSFNPEAPQLYSLTSDNVKLAINSIPEIPEETTFYLGILLSESANCTLSLEVTKGRFDGMDIYLDDYATGKTHNISKNRYYNFAAEAGEITGRFGLRFGKLNEQTNIDLTIYSMGKSLYIINHTKSALVEVYDASGQIVLKRTVGEGLNVIGTSLATGAYMVRLLSGTTIATQKIVIL